MAESVFSNLRVRGTLTVVGAFAAGIVTVTTLTATTGNFTTANIQTLSGSVVSATDPSDLIEGTTISGSTLRNTAGSFIVDATDVESTVNISGSTLRMSVSMTGAKLSLTPTTGTSALQLYGGAKGSHICIRDTDGAGWTEIDALNGTVTARIASAGNCP